jgi:hypothetical protein
MRSIIISLIIITTIIVIIYFFNKNSPETFDNLIPNSLRWNILTSKTKCDFQRNWETCNLICNRMGRSKLGCIQSCNDLIRDQLFSLRNNKYNWFV